jgi:hypothetical protein
VAATNILVYSVCFRLHFVKEKKSKNSYFFFLSFALSFLPKKKLLHILSGGVRDHALHLGWRFFDEFHFARFLEGSFVRQQTITY